VRWPLLIGSLLVGLLLIGGCSDDSAKPAGSPSASAATDTATLQPSTAPPPATLVLTGGKVATVDPALGTTEAIALRGHLIAAVGSNDDIAAYVGPDTDVINLNGRLVIPGFIEGHGHYLSLGRAKQILDLSTAKTWDDIVGQVAIAVDKAEPGEWIFGRGWHQDKWQSITSVRSEVVDGVPVNDSLTAISPDNPVYLGHASGHAAYANAAALTAAGITNDSSDPAGGTIVRANNGRPTGLLRENAQDAVEDAITRYDQRLSPDETAARLRQQSDLAAAEALAHGVTSFHDAGASFATIDFLKTLEAENALPVRLYVMVRGESNKQMAERLSGYLMPAQGNDFLAVRSIKRQIDGALGAHGAWLLEPYDDMPDSTGLVLEPIEDIEHTAELALANGYQLNTHAIGDRANRETLDLYERAFTNGKVGANVDGKALRWRIEHAQHIHPADVPRFGSMGVIAAMQGVHCVSDGPSRINS